MILQHTLLVILLIIKLCLYETLLIGKDKSRLFLKINSASYKDDIMTIEPGKKEKKRHHRTGSICNNNPLQDAFQKAQSDKQKLPRHLEYWLKSTSSLKLPL